MDSVKIDLKELEKVLKQREKFDYSTQPIEFLWGYDSTLIGAVPKLIKRVRELERQTVVLASHLSKHVMHTMSTKEWLEWSESVAKEDK